MFPERGFEDRAAGWLAWARTPDHDAYWDYRDQFFDGIVPRPGRRTLEIGCGEGRVSRDLRRRGHSLTATDVSPTLVTAAQTADPEGRYMVADATGLPFKEGEFDLVVAYMVLMDVEDMTAAVREAARVLESGGFLCVGITHPLADAGAFESREPDAPFTITGSYQDTRRIAVPMARNGLAFTFTGWAYPFEAYARAFESAGLLIERLREPAPPDRTLGADPSKRRWQRIPCFLFMRCRKG
ncbi:MAG TPA: class I SAM-dependent methyltransferase [Candidatus Limnocylindrales bacterium]|nr:class I SAM-dependent methyltransferase [Candidatus Limnocylindrales bacterium]